MIEAVLMVIAAAASPSDSQSCDSATFVSSRSAVISALEASAIVTSMSMPEIVHLIGPAAREVGSGLYILQWDVSDGRVLSVSAPNPCAKAMVVHLREYGA